MKYKVRDPFVIKIGRDVFKGGDVVELMPEQAAAHRHKLEAVTDAPKKATK